MARPSFSGLSKSKNGPWKIHYQHHHSSIRIAIPSQPKKYFLIKMEDDGALFIKYYDTVLTIGKESFAYSEVLPEICPEFHGDEVAADVFLGEHMDDPRLHLPIFQYCLDHKKEYKKFDTICVNSKLIYCVLSDGKNIEEIFDRFGEIVKCSRQDLLDAIGEYLKTDASLDYDISSSNTARGRSIVDHY